MRRAADVLTHPLHPLTLTPASPSALQIDTQIFSHLVRQEFPVVARHMEAMGADVSCVVVQWFICLFVNFLPLETCLRVWDILFYHRWGHRLLQA